LNPTFSWGFLLFRIFEFMKINQFLDATYLKTASQANISEEKNQQKVVDLLNEAILHDYKLVVQFHNVIVFNIKSKLLCEA
jgi:deoxyribose-phosphate aldolase